MALSIRQLAVFAYKNKQVVQIRIQVSQVEAVLERWSLPTWGGGETLLSQVCGHQNDNFPLKRPQWNC